VLLIFLFDQNRFIHLVTYGVRKIMILFLAFLNILLPLIGYGIAGASSLAFMLVLLAIVDYVAVREYFANRKNPTQQYGRNANHYLFTDKE